MALPTLKTTQVQSGFSFNTSLRVYSKPKSLSDTPTFFPEEHQSNNLLRQLQKKPGPNKCSLFRPKLIKIRESLDGKNIEIVLTELGVRLHRVIYDHLQQFTYNSSGVMAVICDVQVSCISHLGLFMTRNMLGALVLGMLDS